MKRAHLLIPMAQPSTMIGTDVYIQRLLVGIDTVIKISQNYPSSGPLLLIWFLLCKPVEHFDSEHLRLINHQQVSGLWYDHELL